MLSLNQCKKLIENPEQYSDEEIVQIRDTYYKLAEIIIEQFKNRKKEEQNEIEK